MTTYNHEKEMLSVLLEVSRKVSSSLDIDKVAKTILEQAKSFLSADYSTLFLIDDRSKQLLPIGAIGFKSDQLENLAILGGWEKINAELIRTGKSMVVNETEKVFPLGGYIAVPLRSKTKIIGSLIVCNSKKRNVIFTEDDKRLLYTLANQVSVALLNAQLYKNLKDLYVSTVASLADAIDARDPYTRGHSDRVSQYSVAISQMMGESERFVENIRLSGLLHDVGKIGIRDNVLSKAGALNADELKKIQEHPMIGTKIVHTVIKMPSIIRGIREHHERYDGKGYPKGLSGDRISLEGKIIAVADTYDSITTDRPYRKGMSAKEGIMEIVHASGTQFDPAVVQAFQRSVSNSPEIWNFV